MSLNTEGQNNTVIQINAVILDMRGALGATIGVLEENVSIHISNYNPQTDTVNLVRNSSRILITVNNKRITRGSCIITASEPNQLQEILIHNNSKGILNISLPDCNNDVLL